MSGKRGVLLATMFLSMGFGGASAWAREYAPIDQPGPSLAVPVPMLRHAVTCTANVARSDREPVLLVPGTGAAPDEEFYAYYRTLEALEVPYCSVRTPEYATADIQTSAQYVVYAIRYMHQLAGRRIALLGGSQGGGPEQRWPLRFWPDVRAMVEDSIEQVPTNHGAATLNTMCAGAACANAICPGLCVPALWQQADNSAFTAAMNSGQETFPGIDYSVIYSTTDEFVQPNLDDTGTSSLHGGGGSIRNIALQDVCPGHVADHIGAVMYDPVVYALSQDALDHRGPANPARIDAGAVCSASTMPHTSAAESSGRQTGFSTTIFTDRFQNLPRTPSEPPLACYVTGTCATKPPGFSIRSVRRSARGAIRLELTSTAPGRFAVSAAGLAKRLYRPAHADVLTGAPAAVTLRPRRSAARRVLPPRITVATTFTATDLYRESRTITVDAKPRGG